MVLHASEVLDVRAMAMRMMDGFVDVGLMAKRYSRAPDGSGHA